MAEVLEIYKCESCGNIVEVFHAGPGELVCCGCAMTRQTANTVEASKEKHLPVIDRGDGTIKVKVGSVPHPMESAHFIEWIELIADGRVYRARLLPGESPEASFAVSADRVTAREFCSVHGQWSAEG